MSPSHIAHRLTQAATYGLQSRPAKQVQPVRSGARGGSLTWVVHVSPEYCRLMNLKPGFNGTSLRLDADRGMLQRLAEACSCRYLLASRHWIAAPGCTSIPPTVNQGFGSGTTTTLSCSLTEKRCLSRHSVLKPDGFHSTGQGNHLPDSSNRALACTIACLLGQPDVLCSFPWRYVSVQS